VSLTKGVPSFGRSPLIIGGDLRQLGPGGESSRSCQSYANDNPRPGSRGLTFPARPAIYEAHRSASRIEYHCRAHPEELEKNIRLEMDKNG
jgi:hypothetical protein